MKNTSEKTLLRWKFPARRPRKRFFRKRLAVPGVFSGRTAVLKKVGKFFLKTLGVLLVLFFTGIAFRDQLFYIMLTKIGSMVSGVDIRADEVEVSFARGDVKIINLTVCEPQNCDFPQLMKLSSLYVRIDKSALFSGKLRLAETEIRNLELFGRIDKNGEFNLRKFIRFVQNNKDDEGAIQFKDVQINNVKAVIADQRKNGRIDGTGFFLSSFSASSGNGKAVVRNFQISSPEAYSHNILELDCACIQFPPGTLLSDAPELQNIEVTGLRAIAGFRGYNSCLHDLFETFSLLFFTSGTPEITEPFPVPVNRFRIRDMSLAFRDIKQKNNIHGFGIDIGELNGSWPDGNIKIKKLSATNPKGFNRKMLDTGSIEIKFAPGTVLSNSPEISSVYVDNVHAVAGFREDNRNNLYEIFSALNKFFNPANISSADEADEADADEPFLPVIKELQLNNVSLAIWDGRSVPGINGFKINFKKLQSLWQQGRVSVNELLVTPPEGYNRNMLQVKSASVKFFQDDDRNNTGIIENISIDGLQANAELKAGNNSNINEVAAAAELLCSPFIPMFAAEGLSGKDGTAPVDVLSCDLKNCSFAIRDYRTDNSVDGFSIQFQDLSYSRKANNFCLRNLRMTNPRSYTRPDLLTLGKLTAKFRYADGEQYLQQLKIDGMHGVLEYRRKNTSNIHEVADALCLVFMQIPPCTDYSISDLQEADTSVENQKVDLYSIKNSSIVIWDIRNKIPLTIPLAKEEKDSFFESSEVPLLQSLHAQAVELSDACEGVTDPSTILLYFLNSTQKSGVELLKKTHDNGKEIFNKFFDLIL